jgi:hypothetical protein
MHAIEFIAELGPNRMLPIPPEAVAQLPKSGTVRVIIVPDELTEDAQWNLGAYEQFFRDDDPEDAIYDSYQ